MRLSTITWEELGCPQSPMTVTVRGMTLDIEDRHIEAAVGERHATFPIIEGRPIAGSPQYVLGTRLG